MEQLNSDFRLPKKPRSSGIYITLLVSLCIIFGSLPFIPIIISTKAYGVIRPIDEPSILRSLVNAQVIKSNLKENKTVILGDTLLILDSSKLRTELAQIDSLIITKENLINELKLLLEDSNSDILTSKYRLIRANFNSKYKKAEFELSVNNDHLEKIQYLYDNHVVSEEELISTKAKTKNLEFKLEELTKEYELRLASELHNLNTEIELLMKDRTILEHHFSDYVIIANHNSIVKDLKKDLEGENLVIGQEICQLVPNSMICVEALVPMRDIAYIRTGLESIVYSDSYDYQQWGNVSSKIIRIDKNPSLINNEYYYKIRCELLTNTLTHRNGIQASLIMGSTCFVKIKLYETTLLRVIIDRVQKFTNYSSI